MPYCPQCSSPVEANAESCQKCGALFGPDSTWKPTDQPSSAQSETAGPKGIRGWLILPLLGLIITPFRMAFQFVTDLWPVLNATTWQALTSPGSPTYHALWGLLIVFEVVANVAVFAFGLWVLVVFLQKSKRTPRLFIVWMATLVAIQVIDVVLVNQIPAVAAQTDQQIIKDLGRAVIGAAIWIPYFLLSKRVKNTFVH